MKVKMLWMVGCAWFALSACGDGEEGGDREVDRALLVYLGGDSNLSRETAGKITALQEGWRAGDAPVFVYVDDASSRGGSLLLRLAGDRDEWFALDTLAVYEEENSASPGVLRRVAGEVRSRCPARSYGLLLFSHASGWLPAGTLQRPLAGRSLIIDDGGETREEMEMTGFADALPDGMFDFIVFETCLTANVELAYALRHKTRYIVASAAEIVSPGFTLVYPVALAHLLDARGSLPGQLQAFATAYFQRASTDPRHAFSATISVIRTAALEELARAARDIHARQGEVSLDTNALQRFDRPGRYDGDTPALPRYFDLDEYMERLAGPAGHAAFREAMARVVLYEQHTPQFLLHVNDENGFEIRRHGGLTTYIERPAFPYLNERYRDTEWYRDTR
jgi:hypothetical protein